MTPRYRITVKKLKSDLLAKAAAARAYKGELILTYGNELGTARRG